MVKVKLSGAWFGEKSKLNETIAPFLAGLPTPGSQYSGGGSWLECMAFPSGGNLDVSAPDGIDNFYAKSLFTKEGHPVTKKAAEAFINYLSNEGVGSSAVSACICSLYTVLILCRAGSFNLICMVGATRL
jgi:hypothetical protein